MSPTPFTRKHNGQSPDNGYPGGFQPSTSGNLVRIARGAHTAAWQKAGVKSWLERGARQG